MLIREMRFDQLQNFSKCIIQVSGVYAIDTVTGSSSGTNFSSSKRSDTMQAFDKTISQKKVRVI